MNRLYLDNCMFNRPFDDQSNINVRLESEAKLNIQENIRAKNYDLVWSYILDFENNKNPFRERREQIAKWSSYASENIIECQSIIALANSINSFGFGAYDSLHIASAIEVKADYFLTTDKGILKRADFIKEIQILDPIQFVRETYK